MRAFLWKKAIVRWIFAGLICFGVVPARVFADDKESKSTSVLQKSLTAPPARTDVAGSQNAPADAPLPATAPEIAGAEPFAFADFAVWLDDCLAAGESPQGSTTEPMSGTSAGPASSSISGNPDLTGSGDSADAQAASTNSKNVLTGNFFHR